MSYATVTDVTSRWIGTPEPPEVAVVQKYLDDAETLLAWEVSGLHERSAREPSLVERIILVECRMVIRALKNPDLVRQVSHTTGPFTESSTYGSETLTGLSVTPEDLALLEPPERTRQRAFTIDAADGPNSFRCPVVNV